MKKIVVLFSGEGTNFDYLAKNLPKTIEIAFAICNNPHAKGIEVAKKYNIPLVIIDSKAYRVREEFDKELVALLQREQLDLVVLAGFMRILTSVFTSQIKAINLHPSLLPRHKGMNAIEKSYNDELKTGGVTVHWVSDELDGGDIIIQKSISKDGLSFDEYHKEIKKIEKIALLEAVEKIVK